MLHHRLLVPTLLLAMTPLASAQGITGWLDPREPSPPPTPHVVAPPTIVQRPAARGNYRPASRTQITEIVIHKAEGENASGWFALKAAKGSAHYDVHKDGTIYQSVQDDDIAPHAGNGATHRRSIGIEHAGFSAKNDTTEAQYRASAQLVAYLCAKYSIPIDRQHVIGHDEVPHPKLAGRRGGLNGHTDPGPHWNWDHYMRLVRSFAGPEPRRIAAIHTVESLPSVPLTRAPRTLRAPASSPESRPQLGLGSRGPAVKELQTLLRARGFDPGTPDGAFGSRTLAAVRAFQASRGLARDGVVGPNTWAALVKPR